MRVRGLRHVAAHGDRFSSGCTNRGHDRIRTRLAEALADSRADKLVVRTVEGASPVAVTVVGQSVFNGGRVLLSYRVLDFGGDAVTIGAFTAAFSFVPLLIALRACSILRLISALIRSASC